MNALFEQYAPPAQVGIGAPFRLVAWPATVAVAAPKKIQRTQSFTVQQFFGLAYMSHVPIVKSSLQDTIRRAGRVEHFPGCVRASPERFFAQDMFSGLQGGDG